MKQKSVYFKKEFEVETDSLHGFLKDVINNQMEDETGVMYSYESITNSPEHPVFVCTICDKKGRRIQAVGECSGQEPFPYEAAVNRAFDEAAISYLGLPRKVLPKQPAVTKVADVKTSNDEEPAPYENAVVVTSSSSDADSDSAEAGFSDAGSEVSKFGSIVVEIGKNKKARKTVAELYESDKQWLDYVCDRVIVANDQQQQQIDAAKAYIKAMG